MQGTSISLFIIAWANWPKFCYKVCQTDNSMNRQVQGDAQARPLPPLPNARLGHLPKIRSKPGDFFFMIFEKSFFFGSRSKSGDFFYKAELLFSGSPSPADLAW